MKNSKALLKESAGRGSCNESQRVEMLSASKCRSCDLGLNSNGSSCTTVFISTGSWRGLCCANCFATPLGNLSMRNPKGKFLNTEILGMSLAIHSTLPPSRKASQLSEINCTASNGRMYRHDRQRVWKSNKGRGIVELVDEMVIFLGARFMELAGVDFCGKWFTISSDTSNQVSVQIYQSDHPIARLICFLER